MTPEYLRIRESHSTDADTGPGGQRPESTQSDVSSLISALAVSGTGHRQPRVPALATEDYNIITANIKLKWPR